ncbi:DUF6759 domain-containing protein [Chryseobacterium sp. JUb7]|uniref:DUF6759 domain-containing protein n=1 Tax=Chryseobacterium sp. JUb7 TaxID=2940599 RepID=UPI002166ED7E|nr:DUF6759 domain-containing protein [Chryseobacterium sp. JUb7]MCS3530712.1 hypothetical protein [Chryseobacterium sp. JUb7]
MKKIFLLIFLCIFTLGFSQKKKKAKTKAVVEKETVIIYTEEEAENSKELRVIAGFLKQNPGHAKTEYFKKKLMQVMLADASPDVKLAGKSVSTSKSEGIVKGNNLKDNSKTLASNDAVAALKAERTVKFASVSSPSKTAGVNKKAEPSDESKRTAAMLTHLFNNDVNKNEAYINIRNKSKCPLNVKISGRKSYTLNIPAKSQNFILIDKGEYTLSTMVCDAAYSSLKKIDKDIEIALNVAE